MVTITEAVLSAMAFAQDTLGKERTSDLQLEEVESGTAEGNEAWLITLSIPDPAKGLAFIANPRRSLRDYKTFAVQKATGEVVSMKIRELTAG